MEGKLEKSPPSVDIDSKLRAIREQLNFLEDTTRRMVNAFDYVCRIIDGLKFTI